MVSGNSDKRTLYRNKEISWLSFNSRVLQEAADPGVPLIERLKYLAIFSSNLDEFFRVRVATLRRLSYLGKKSRKIIGHDARDVLSEIQDIVLEQHKEFDNIYLEILAELAKEKIFIINEQQLNEEQGEFVKEYFHYNVRPKLVPIMLDQIDEMPDLHDHYIYLAVTLSKIASSKKPKFALIELPTASLSRFLILPQIGDHRYIILLDDVIRYCLEDIFSMLGYDHFEAHTIKLTRDAELDIKDDFSQSFIKKISKSLKQRKEANPVRFIYDANLPKQLLNLFVDKLGIGDHDTLIAGTRYHNFKDFMSFPNFGSKHLRYQPLELLPHNKITLHERMIDIVDKNDILIHFCYQPFDYVIDMLREAAIDPKVISIKVTVYRLAKNSAVINALVNAAKNGKDVTVIMELQARFDEEANIRWANALQEEGVRVISGVPGLKVHSKLVLITRIKGSGRSRYAMLGTGNLNEDTAPIYSDHLLCTSDRKITAEVDKVFEFFENNYKVNNFKHLIVSPFNTRNKIMGLIHKEIKNAKSGKEAWIFIKLNNLVDSEVIDKLYEASQAGVKVKLIVRSMFSLIPGVEGMSENIKAISIVDKFLEHSRIFIFCNDGDEKYYISSADLMPRNLDHRVEVTCPIYDKEIQEELRSFMELQWNDNVKARILNETLDNNINENDTGRPIRAQFDFYDYLKSRTEITDGHDTVPSPQVISVLNPDI